MCTSLSFTGPALFGRNLDLERSFGQKVVITPRGAGFVFRRRAPLPRHHAMIGMATQAGNTALYAEACNEKGLYMAGLNFPGNAYYLPEAQARDGDVAPHELISLVLGSCANLDQARALLEGLRLVATPFAPGYPLAPLHWHVADATGALAVEPMKDGLHVYENPVGVLTNSPPFPHHVMNLSNYQGLSPQPPENSLAPGVELAVYGCGLGAAGLPGDASPMSRFVRATFHKCHAVFGATRAEQVVQFFRLLDTVAMPRGSVAAGAGYEETLYTCCIDAKALDYYYRTNRSGRICAVAMGQAGLEGEALRTYPLEEGPGFLWVGPEEQVAPTP